MANNQMTTRIKGEIVTIRPLTAADAALEARFLQGLSGAEPHPQEEPVQDAPLMAFAGTVQRHGGEQLIGICRYSPTRNPGQFGMALTVPEEWQRQGLAELLMSQLMGHALKRGVQLRYPVELDRSYDLQELARELGMSFARDPAPVSGGPPG